MLTALKAEINSEISENLMQDPTLLYNDPNKANQSKHKFIIILLTSFLQRMLFQPSKRCKKTEQAFQNKEAVDGSKQLRNSCYVYRNIF